jgi:hypothetical protein
MSAGGSEDASLSLLQLRETRDGGQHINDILLKQAKLRCLMAVYKYMHLQIIDQGRFDTSGNLIHLEHSRKFYFYPSRAAASFQTGIQWKSPLIVTSPSVR